MNPLKTPTSYKQHIEDRFGRKGTPKRDEFDKKSLKFKEFLPIKLMKIGEF